MESSTPTHWLCRVGCYLVGFSTLITVCHTAKSDVLVGLLQASVESSTPTHWLCRDGRCLVGFSTLTAVCHTASSEVLVRLLQALVESSTPTHLLCKVDVASSAFPRMLQFVTLYIVAQRGPCWPRSVLGGMALMPRVGLRP